MQSHAPGPRQLPYSDHAKNISPTPRTPAGDATCRLAVGPWQQSLTIPRPVQLCSFAHSQLHIEPIHIRFGVYECRCILILIYLNLGNSLDTRSLEEKEQQYRSRLTAERRRSNTRYLWTTSLPPANTYPRRKDATFLQRGGRARSDFLHTSSRAKHPEMRPRIGLSLRLALLLDLRPMWCRRILFGRM